MLTDFVSGFLARRALSKREQKQNNVLLFWDKAQRAKKVVNISLPIAVYYQIRACRLANFSVCYIKLQDLTHFWPIFTSK